MTSLSRVNDRLASLFPFVRRFAASITGMLTCVDRVICQGYLPIMHQAGFEGFVDGDAEADDRQTISKSASSSAA